jgi:homoserine/homoserine lactone efflux protein
MLLSSWLIYVSVAVVTIASPGPAMLLAMSNSVQYGMRTVVLSSIGNIIGLFGVSALAMAGVGALLKASASTFFILKVCGAAYLFYLGLKQWQSRKSIFIQLDAEERTTGPGRSRIFSRAVLLALTNPKTILFFSALFPQFLIPSKALLPQFLILTCTFTAISFASLMAYGFSASFMQKWMLAPRRNIWFNKIFGSMFMFFGMSILAMRNTTK